MHIKTALVTGTATIIALAAVAVVVITVEPATAGPRLITLLWVAVFLAVWGFLCTLLLVARQSIAQAVWTTLPPTILAIILLRLLQRSALNSRLLEGTILATLVLSFVLWWKIHRMQKQTK